MKPAHGVTLVIDDEVISDEAHVIVNGSEAVAWVHNPDEDPETGAPVGMETVGKLVKATEQRNPPRITGTDPITGQEQTWQIRQGRGCRDC